ncbi:cysteine desulfurase family protein [Hyphomicrobium sp.]|uniref:cysteine desulfurase family protein n=1 Tax=Hyphomicrobium sp. TaxID=82 RepID=UPI002E37B717|nr:cysteine desulfurase family protein [Hyphomicrobium sp.]HEX2840317.1 cysteine desulfurase family protein [Hyphomicrobium sp.]
MSVARTYLDYNASAPLRPEARDAVVAALDVFGNASSVHTEGRRARALVDEARASIAELVNADPAEIVFTSGATEANTWALTAPWDRIAVAGIEHDSVRAPAAQTAAERGVKTIELPATPDGTVDYKTVGLGAGTLMVLQRANNETGVLQDVEAAGLWATENGVRIHCDAVQAPGRIPINFRTLGATTLSLSAHKIGGPKGIGALVISGNAPLPPLFTGGGQEVRRRAGTENVAGIAGFGAAARAALRDLADTPRVAALRDQLEAEVLRATPEAVVLGANAPRLPNTSSIALPGHSAETLVIKFDLAGIAISAGAACSSGKVGQSHVLTAMGLAPEVARSAIRVSLGTQTTEQDIAAFLAAWKRICGSASLAA